VSTFAPGVGRGKGFYPEHLDTEGMDVYRNPSHPSNSGSAAVHLLVYNKRGLLSDTLSNCQSQILFQVTPFSLL
jgi:hypothetical protein